MTMLSPTDRRQLDELGYVVLPDFVPPTMLEAMRILKTAYPRPKRTIRLPKKWGCRWPCLNHTVRARAEQSRARRRPLRNPQPVQRGDGAVEPVHVAAALFVQSHGVFGVPWGVVRRIVILSALMIGCRDDAGPIAELGGGQRALGEWRHYPRNLT